MKERRREKGREEEEEERYQMLQFCKEIMILYGLYGYLDLCMVIGLFHF